MKLTFKMAAAILIMAGALGACGMETDTEPTAGTEPTPVSVPTPEAAPTPEAEVLTRTETAMVPESAQESSPLLGTTWSLVEIQSMDDSVAAPPEGKTFSVTLAADGRAAIQADCNRGGGNYTLEGSSLEFGPVATTKMFCGPDGFDGRFLKELGFVRSYVLEDGKLFLATMADGSILEFAVAENSGE